MGMLELSEWQLPEVCSRYNNYARDTAKWKHLAVQDNEVRSVSHCKPALIITTIRHERANVIATIVRSIAVAGLLLGLMDTHKTAEAVPPPGNACCNLVEQALKDVSVIRVGSKRADVERNFIESGGASFGTELLYEYKKCHYIKVSVTFTYVNGASESSADVVNKISQLSIDYDVKD
jgi:hypothetical protein